MQHVLKMQYISVLPKYIHKKIPMDIFCICSHTQMKAT